MKWMQFFTPVTSITWEEANSLVEENPAGDVVFLDVRQPREYQNGHMPGAKLLPLRNLESRLNEIDRDEPTVIY